MPYDTDIYDHFPERDLVGVPNIGIYPINCDGALIELPKEYTPDYGYININTYPKSGKLGEDHEGDTYALPELTYRVTNPTCQNSTDTFSYSFPSDSGTIKINVNIHCPTFDVYPEQSIYSIEQNIRSLYIAPVKSDSRVVVVYSQDKPNWYPWMELNPEFETNGAVSFNTMGVPIGIHKISINYTTESLCLVSGTIQYDINIITTPSNFTDTILGKIIAAIASVLGGMFISYIYGKCATKLGLPDTSTTGAVVNYFANNELSCTTNDKGETTCKIQERHVTKRNYEYI